MEADRSVYVHAGGGYLLIEWRLVFKFIQIRHHSNSGFG